MHLPNRLAVKSWFCFPQLRCNSPHLEGGRVKNGGEMKEAVCVWGGLKAEKNHNQKKIIVKTREKSGGEEKREGRKKGKCVRGRKERNESILQRY